MYKKKSSGSKAPRKFYRKKVVGFGDYDTKKRSGKSKRRQSIGRQLGAELGDLAEKGIRLGAKVMGFGDYVAPAFQPKENTLMNSMVGNDPPMIVNSSYGTIIRHREYLGDVLSGPTAAFNVFGNYPINPGLEFTFPWFSAIAQNFQEWRPRGILFEFKSTSADALNSTNTALGTVIMATQYDSSKGPNLFLNKQQMENHEFASSARQSCSMLHPIECSPDRNPQNIFYTRFGNEPSNFDIRNADLGIFTIATVGQQGASVNIGELWVTYEIELLKPQLVTPLGQNLLSYKAFNSTSVSTAGYFGNLAALVVRSGSLLPITVTANSIIFPQQLTEGSFMVVYNVIGAATASVITPTITPTGCSIVQMWNNDNSSQAGNPSSANAATFTSVIVVNINAASATLVYSGGTLPTSITSMDLAINQWNSLIQT